MNTLVKLYMRCAYSISYKVHRMVFPFVGLRYHTTPHYPAQPIRAGKIISKCKNGFTRFIYFSNYLHFYLHWVSKLSLLYSHLVDDEFDVNIPDKREKGSTYFSKHEISLEAKQDLQSDFFFRLLFIMWMYRVKAIVHWMLNERMKYIG